MPESEIELIDEGSTGKEGGANGHEGDGAGAALTPNAIESPLSSVDELSTSGLSGVISFIKDQLRFERERAERAEEALRALREQLSQTESVLARTREALDAVERKHQIDLMLVQSETVDLESSRLLTELALQQMPERDVALAVRELRRSKPFLFKARRGIAGAAMSPVTGAPDPAEHAADEAARTGDRGALLRYLRARRGS